MSAGNMIVAFPDQAKGHLAEMWDPSNNSRLEVPPLGFRHTVDTVDELGRALFDDWCGNEMLVYLAPKVYPVMASEIEIEDARLGFVDKA